MSQYLPSISFVPGTAAEEDSNKTWDGKTVSFGKWDIGDVVWSGNELRRWVGEVYLRRFKSCVLCGSVKDVTDDASDEDFPFSIHNPGSLSVHFRISLSTMG